MLEEEGILCNSVQSGSYVIIFSKIIGIKLIMVNVEFLVRWESVYIA